MTYLAFSLPIKYLIIFLRIKMKESLEISFKKQDQITLEKLAAFIKACRLRRNSSPITTTFNVSSMKRILVVVTNQEALRVETFCKKIKFKAILRERPLPEDLPIYMHATRGKTTKNKSVTEVISEETLREDTISNYLVKDLNTIYTDGLDHRIYTISTEDKHAFYRQYSTLETLAEISMLKPLKVTEVSMQTAEESEYAYYNVVRVNSREMVTYYKTTPHSILAIDCEMVITELGIELARISIVNEDKNVVYDQIIEPTSKVRDYLTNVSGISESMYKTKCTCTTCLSFSKNKIPEHNSEIKIEHSGSISYEVFLYDLSSIVGVNTILVGHSISHDLFSMNIFHKKLIDTSLLYNSKNHHRYKLKALCLAYLNREIQQSAHSSIVDAQACIDLLKYFQSSKKNSQLQYQKMKNISISTDYANVSSRLLHKSTPPIDYIYTNESPPKISENTLIICLVKNQDDWHVLISNT